MQELMPVIKRKHVHISSAQHGATMRPIIFFLVLIIAASVEAASFDCSLAQSAIEKMICSNPEISKADVDLSLKYRDIKNKSRYTKDLIKEQLVWLKERNACKTESCVLEKYKAREAVLNSWLQNESEKAKVLESCTDRPECWPEGSAMHFGLSSVEDKVKYEKAIDISIKQIKSLKKFENSPIYYDIYKRIEKFISASKEYRDSKCSISGALTGGGGSWPSAWASNCEAQYTKILLGAVEKSEQCVKNKILQIEKDQDNYNLTSWEDITDADIAGCFNSIIENITVEDAFN